MKKTHARKAKAALDMKRTLIPIVMIGYMALLISLLVISWYLISDYQRKNQEEDIQVLHNFIEDTQNTVNMMDRHIFEIYAYSPYFTALSKVNTEIDDYQNAYYLKDAMDKKMLLSEGLHGYNIQYDLLSKSWYNIDGTWITSEKVMEINRLLSKEIALGANASGWRVINSGSDTYLVVTSSKENAALTLFHNLRSTEQQLKADMGNEAHIVLIQGSQVVSGVDHEKLLGLRSALDDSNTTYAGRIQSYYVYAEYLSKVDLWACVSLPYGFSSIMNIQQFILLLITLGSIFAVILLYRFLRKEFIAPLKELNSTMDMIRLGGEHSVPESQARFRELQDVNHTLALMVSEIEKQKVLVYEEIIDKQKAQMQCLQLQLEPHFYLNSLKTLNVLALENETDKIQGLIFSLSAHLRYLLQSGQDIVPLQLEMDFVRNYIEMQQYVTGRQVQCEFHIDASEEAWSVPVLCIQTFVENSVKYTKFGNSKLPLKLIVSAQRLAIDGKSFLDLIVKDNGQGYPEDILDQLNGETAANSPNIGINNLKKRCQLLYTDAAEYQFYNDNGAVSELIIPEPNDLKSI